MKSTTLLQASAAKARKSLALCAVIFCGIGCSYAASDTPTAFSAPGSTSAASFATPSSAEYRSKDGRLDVTLRAQQTVVRLGTTDISGATYNGHYGGPVLRVRPGDFLHVHLVIELPHATNIHFHGLNVSPQGHGDNSMHMVAPGESWDYKIPVPKDHPPGVYWIHTHAHEAAERQLMGGLSGTLVVEGLQDQVPSTRPLKERMFALKEFSPDENGRLNRVPKPNHVVIKTINGELMPTVGIEPGESQLWRFSDQTANTYFRLTLANHQFTVIGRDGQPLRAPEKVSELMIGPGQRVDVIVTASGPGDFKLVAEKTSTGPAGDMFRAQDMATLRSATVAGHGAPLALAKYVLALPAPEPISDSRIDARRLATFSEDPVTQLFFINHETFDPEKVDFKVPLGSIEE